MFEIKKFIKSNLSNIKDLVNKDLDLENEKHSL